MDRIIFGKMWTEITVLMIDYIIVSCIHRYG